jgi:hypothetical protein
MVTTREEYQKEITARLRETETQIGELMAHATSSDYDEYLTDIRIKQESAKAKLAQLEEATGEAWQNLRAQLDKAVSEVQSALLVAMADSG